MSISAEKAAKCTTHYHACHCREFAVQQLLAEKDAEIIRLKQVVRQADEFIPPLEAKLAVAMGLLKKVDPWRYKYDDPSLPQVCDFCLGETNHLPTCELVLFIWSKL